MNYYEHHIGDYDQATAHLTACEDGIYGRLIRWYMAGEAPLPLDIKAIQRRVRAHSRDERAAVQTVLAEFFDQRPDGYHQHRCDEEIGRFRDKQAKAKASANARWSNRAEQSEGNANASPNADAQDMRTHMRTQSEGNAPRARPQTPDTRHEYPHTPAKRGQAAIGLKAWLEAIKAAGEQPVPPEDPVFAYAVEVGIPADFLRLAWLEFRHRYCQPEAKRYRDWRAVFRKAVRGNWLKLWWLDPASQQYGLTTVGQQAQRAHLDRKSA